MRLARSVICDRKSRVAISGRDLCQLLSGVFAFGRGVEVEVVEFSGAHGHGRCGLCLVDIYIVSSDFWSMVSGRLLLDTGAVQQQTPRSSIFHDLVALCETHEFISKCTLRSIKF